MYLMLHTQGVEYDVVSKWDEWQLRCTTDARLADLLQFYLKASKGLETWLKKHSIEPDQQRPVSNSAGTVYKFAIAYSFDDEHKKRDLLSAGFAGVAEAALTWDWDRGSWVSYVHMKIRQSMLREIRKFYRWDKEQPIIEDDEENDGVLEAMWQEPAPSPEEEYLREEGIEQVNRLISKIIPKLTERESHVFWGNIHTESPVSVRDIADQFRVGKSSIHRDKKRILKLLKEVGVYDGLWNKS